MCARYNTVGMFTDVDEVINNDATVQPDISSDDVTTVTGSVKRRLTIDNELMTYSAAVNITGLDHFTQYIVKVIADSV